MQGLEYIFAVPCLISMNNYIFDVEKETNHIVEWIRAFFEANGKDCKAVLGISGGKDSSVAAALCVKALGKDRVFGVLMQTESRMILMYRMLYVSFWILTIRSLTLVRLRRL